MLIKCIGLTALMLGALWMAGRELAALARDRRAHGAPTRPALRRFRRRAKGLILLQLLYVTAIFHDEWVALGSLDARQVILLVGLAVVIAGWILILAARDTHAAAMEAVEESRRLRAEAVRTALGGGDAAGPP